MFLTRGNVVSLTCRFLNNITVRNHHVAVIGSATDLGQTVSMMLRTEPSVTKLTVHDNLPHNKGVILDLSHIPSPGILEGYTGEEYLINALKGASIVLAVGGFTDMPGLSKDAQFNRNTEFIKDLGKEISRIRPMPFLGIATEPVNSTVPMIAEVIRYFGEINPKKLFGITGTDALRAVSMYSALHGINPYECFVPVIGGHSAETIIPLLSQAQPSQPMSEKEMRDFAQKLRISDEIVTEAKRGWGPSVSVACSVLQFTRGIINALDGKVTKLNVFMENNDFGTSYVQGLAYINKEGAAEMARYTNLLDCECELLEKSIPKLRLEVAEGKKILEQD